MPDILPLALGVQVEYVKDFDIKKNKEKRVTSNRVNFDPKYSFEYYETDFCFLSPEYQIAQNMKQI
jgi:hypothetical protein